MRIITAIAFLFCVIASCNQSKKNNPGSRQSPKQPIVKLLPLGNIDDKYVKAVLARLQKTIPAIKLLKGEPLPAFAFYPPRNRYRADSIIHWLQRRAAYNETFIAITAADISSSRGAVKDFGIMGLGFSPGRACVASLFRLKNKNNFYKVAIHELGHTTGLPHCPEKACYLRDAKGGDPTSQETGFCEKCTAYLKHKGWKL